MSDKYILDDAHNPVEVDDLLEWADAFEKVDRHVRASTLAGGVKVSTVFLGLDHRFDGDGPPILFETMVFGGPHDRHTERYCTWDEAASGHARVCAMVSP